MPANLVRLLPVGSTGCSNGSCLGQAAVLKQLLEHVLANILLTTLLSMVKL